MVDDRKKTFDRRTLLKTGAATAMLSLSGCADTVRSLTGEENTPRDLNPVEDTPNGEPGNRNRTRPDTPAVTFYSEKADEQYTLFDTNELNPNRQNLANFNAEQAGLYDTIQTHPTLENGNIELDEDTATVTLTNAYVHRDTTLALLIETDSGNFRQVTTTIEGEETEGDSTATPQSEDSVEFQDYSATLDMSSVDIRTKTLGHMWLVGRDPERDTTANSIITAEGFCAVPYSNSNGDSLYVRTANAYSPSIDLSNGESLGNGWAVGIRVDYHDTLLENATERTYIQILDVGERKLVGVSATIPDQEMTSWQNRSNGWKRDHPMPAYVYAVPNRQYISQLAQDLWDAQEKAGASEKQHLQWTKKFVESLDYDANRVPDYREYPPHLAVYRGAGDCTSKTGLINALYRCEPFNVRTGYIKGYYGNTPHMISGIDIRDLPDSFDTSGMVTFSPTQSQFPDTEYAINECVQRAFDIGEYDEEMYELNIFYTDTDLSTAPRIKADAQELY